MKKKIFTTDFIVKVGILSAIEIIFAFISQFITIGPASINLALIPIAFGAIMFGPICGGFLGFLNGAMVLASPETQANFMDTNVFGDWCVFGTILVCLLKCTAAGIASGFIYKLLKNKNEIVAIIVASFIVPIINTSLFLIGAAIFFTSAFKGLLLGVLSFNVLIEIGVTALLTPAIIRVIHIVKSKESDDKVVMGESNEEK